MYGGQCFRFPFFSHTSRNLPTLIFYYTNERKAQVSYTFRFRIPKWISSLLLLFIYLNAAEILGSMRNTLLG